MKKFNYLEMEEVLANYWISRKQMNILLPQLSDKTLRIEFESILEEMKNNKEPFFNSRPILIPIEKVIKKYKINTSYILKEAKRIREREILNDTKKISVKTVS